MSTPETVAGRFKIVDTLVERPSCTIYRATDSELGNREVALKLYVDKAEGNQEWIDGFVSEIKTLRSATHGSLVPIIAGGEEEGTFYVAMEMVDSASLRDKLKADPKAFSLEESVLIISEIAEALGEIHELKIIHGHVDSRAVLFKGDEPRLAGYYPLTIEKILKNTTSQGRLIVEPAYVSPEQVNSSDALTARSDIYSLSVLLYELLTGERPFSAKNPLQLAMMRLNQSPPSPRKINPDIPAVLDAAIIKGMSVNPDDRFSTVDEFIDAINGGKSQSKNPLADNAPLDDGSETIAVSMSTEQVQQLLQAKAQRESGGSAPEAEPLSANGDVAETQMGVTSLGGGANASLVSLGGKDRGRKFILAGEQMFVGADQNCTVVVKGKNIPRRAVLLSKRNDDFFFEALVTDEVQLNNKVPELQESVKLKRGDEISIGDESFRYVAPGEVFTLRDDVADLAIDRKGGKYNKYLLYAAVAIVLVSVGGFWSYQQSKESARLAARKAESAKKVKRKELVTLLLKEGDELFKEGAIIEPLGNNAKEKYEKVLEVSPDHSYAKRRLAEIRERMAQLLEDRKRRQQLSGKINNLLAQADKYYEAGRYVSPPGKNARQLYREVVKMDPINPVAKERLKEIKDIIGDRLRQVEVLFAKAQVYQKLGQFVLPKDENAYDMLQEILKFDPENPGANEALIQMAAASIYEGDKAKSKLDAKAMKKSYLTAQALGVDVAFIEDRMKGAELMKKSKASVMIVDRKKEKSEAASSDPDGQYLDTNEIKRRVTELEIKYREAGKGRADSAFIELK